MGDSSFALIPDNLRRIRRQRRRFGGNARFILCKKDVETEVRAVEGETSGLFKELSRGLPFPFGATFRENGVNFAIHSSAATSVSLCLFTPSDLQRVTILYVRYSQHMHLSCMHL
jgi:hypothetical protein